MKSNFRFKSTVPSLLSLSLLALGACAATDEEPAPPAADMPNPEPPPTPPIEPVEFVPCSAPFTGECATLELPRDHADPAGESLEVFVTRFSNPANPRGALWLAAGGPGGQIAAFTYFIEAYRELFPDLTIYGYEHRGAGRSSALTCTARSCLGKGEELQVFSATQAAHDWHEAIRRTRRGDEPVFLYGTSYGTFLVQRYLALFPNEASGVVLDAVVPAADYFFSDAHADAEATMRRWAEACDRDVYCAERLGSPSWPRIEAALRKVGTDHCAAVDLTPEKVYAFRSAFWDYNPAAYALVPLLYRFDRCNAEDVTFLSSFLDSLFTQQDMQRRLSAGRRGFDVDDPASSNEALFHNVACSELWPQPSPSIDELVRRESDSLLPAPDTRGLAETCNKWPTYRSEYFGRYPTTEVPMLLLNGALDARTPLDRVAHVKDVYSRPHQTFVAIPDGNHGVTLVADGYDISCGAKIMQSFLSDPRGALDTSCLQTIEPVPMRGDPYWNDYYFGIDDLWEATEVTMAPTRFARGSTIVDPLEARMLGR